MLQRRCAGALGARREPLDSAGQGRAAREAVLAEAAQGAHAILVDWEAAAVGVGREKELRSESQPSCRPRRVVGPPLPPPPHAGGRAMLCSAVLRLCASVGPAVVRSSVSLAVGAVRDA